MASKFFRSGLFVTPWTVMSQERRLLPFGRHSMTRSANRLSLPRLLWSLSFSAATAGLGNGVELSSRVELTPEGESISLQAGSFQPVWNWGVKWVLRRASLIVNSVRIVNCANQRNAIREIVLANQNGMPLRR